MLSETVQKWLGARVAENVRPPHQLGMQDWCEKELILTRRCGTPFPGPFRTRPHCPWAEGWFDAFEDPDAHTIVIKKGAQVAATQTSICASLYWLVNDPDPLLFVMPTVDMMRSTSQLRIIPLMEDSPAVAATFTGVSDDIAKLQYKTRLTFSRLVGANSPVGLTSFPHRYLILSEADKIKEQLGKEGSTILLAFSRSVWFWNRKRIVEGTPTTADGYTNRLFLMGDQRMFFVPCPKCGEIQVLKWSQVVFDSDKDPTAAGAEAFYECEECEADLDDNDLEDMVQRGEWIATARPKRKGYVSFWLPGIYSTSDERSLEFLVSKFLTVKDNKADLQQFINEDLGELWEEQPADPIQKGMIYEIRDRDVFPRGTIPTDRDFYLAVIVDVQAAFIEWAVYAFRPHDLYLVDHGLGSVLDEVPPIAEGPYVNDRGDEFVAQLEVLDSGYRTTEVYRYHLGRPGRSMVLKGDTGQGTRQTMPVRQQELYHLPGKKKKLRPGQKIKLWHVHPTYFHEEAAELLHTSAAAEDYDRLKLRLHLHNEVGQDCAQQLTAEQPFEEKKAKTGETRRYWKKIRRRNEQWDLLRYALALRWMMRRDLQRLDRKEKAADRAGEKPASKKPAAGRGGAQKPRNRRASYGPDDADE